MAPAGAFSLSRVTKFKKEFFELQNDQNFVSLRLFRDQVEYILTNYPTISLSQIALFLNKGLESVRYQKKAIQRGIVRNGRPKILAQNVEEDLSLYVTKCCELGLPPTISDIQNYLETKNDIYILADTLRKYYKRSDLYEVKKLAPIENERIQVKPEDINLYFNQLSATIDGMPASFVINLDESGFDKYADASKRYMIIPKGKIINNYGIDRNEKLPFDLQNQTIFYAGPCPNKPNEVIGSVGPTTSYRMDAYSPRLIELGLLSMIGKGKRSKEVIDAIVKCGGVYFMAIGGAAAYMSNCIKGAKIIAFEDLGTEAIRELQVEDMPLIVTIDSHGNNALTM